MTAQIGDVFLWKNVCVGLVSLTMALTVVRHGHEAA